MVNFSKSSWDYKCTPVVFMYFFHSHRALRPCCWALRRREETHDSRYRKHCTAEQRSQRGGCRAAGGPGDITDLGEQVGLGQRKHLCRSTKWGSITHPGVKGGSGRKVGVFPSWAAVKKRKYQRLGGNKNVFLTFLRPGKSRVMAPADSGSGGGPLPGCRRPIVCSWHGLWGLCYKTVLLLSQGSAVTPQMLPTNTITSGMRFQHRNFRGTGHSAHNSWGSG